MNLAGIMRASLYIPSTKSGESLYHGLMIWNIMTLDWNKEKTEKNKPHPVASEEISLLDLFEGYETYIMAWIWTRGRLKRIRIV